MTAPGTARGRYLLSGHDGPFAVETVTAAEDGPDRTWSATRTDPVSGAPVGRLHLRTDALGVTTRLHVEAGGWVLRGGCVGPSALWRRGEQEHEATADGFTGTSPAYAAAVVARLAAVLEVGGTRQLALVAVTEPVLAARRVLQRWTRAADAQWEVADLETGERQLLAVRDGLVDGPGLSLTRL